MQFTGLPVAANLDKGGDQSPDTRVSNRPLLSTGKLLYPSTHTAKMSVTYLKMSHGKVENIYRKAAIAI